MARDLNKSPFPGMDPYLERYWGDVHQALCVYARDLLRKTLPRGLAARMEEYTVIQDDLKSERQIAPDVRVTESTRGRGTVAVASPPKSTPIILENLNEPITEAFVKVIDTKDGNRVITVIEFLSPANKANKIGRQMYLLKQDELLYAGVSLVEVDLIRAGRGIVRAPLAMLEPEDRGLYHVSVTRGWQPSKNEVYPIKLEERLPVIGIPLRPNDEDAVIDLQVLLNQAYENGDYADAIDYTQPPEPPLRAVDAAWAKDWLSTHLD